MPPPSSAQQVLYPAVQFASTSPRFHPKRPCSVRTGGCSVQTMRVRSELGQPQQQPACMWLCRPPAAEPGLGLACPCTHVLPGPLAPCCQLATGFCKGMAAVIAPSLFSPSELRRGCCRQAWLLLCMHASDGGRGRARGGPGVGGPAWQRGGRSTGRGALQWGQGALAQHVLPQGLEFGWNWAGFHPKRHPFGPNWWWFGQNLHLFGPNWGVPSSNLHAGGCAALRQPSQALGWPALAPMCCHAPLPHAASLPLASARGWLL